MRPPLSLGACLELPECVPKSGWVPSCNPRGTCCNELHSSSSNPDNSSLTFLLLVVGKLLGLSRSCFLSGGAGSGDGAQGRLATAKAGAQLLRVFRKLSWGQVSERAHGGRGCLVLWRLLGRTGGYFTSPHKTERGTMHKETSTACRPRSCTGFGGEGCTPACPGRPPDAQPRAVPAPFSPVCRREFAEHMLPVFQEHNPQLPVEVKVNRGRHPWWQAAYRESQALLLCTVLLCAVSLARAGGAGRVFG